MFGDDGSGGVEQPRLPMDADGACRARTGDPQLAKAVQYALWALLDATETAWKHASALPHDTPHNERG